MSKVKGYQLPVRLDEDTVAAVSYVGHMLSRHVFPGRLVPHAEAVRYAIHTTADLLAQRYGAALAGGRDEGANSNADVPTIVDGSCSATG